jgi:hypothetical protein
VIFLLRAFSQTVHNSFDRETAVTKPPKNVHIFVGHRGNSRGPAKREPASKSRSNFDQQDLLPCKEAVTDFRWVAGVSVGADPLSEAFDFRPLQRHWAALVSFPIDINTRQ